MEATTGQSENSSDKQNLKIVYHTANLKKTIIICFDGRVRYFPLRILYLAHITEATFFRDLD